MLNDRSVFVDEMIKFCRIASRSDNENLNDLALALMTYLISKENFWTYATIGLPPELIDYYLLKNDDNSLSLKIFESDIHTIA